jgi:putative MATE family efflux protein
MKKPMTEGAPWKHLLAFSVPLFIGSLLQQLYMTADAIIVGRFAGEASLSALGTTGSVLFLTIALAIGFSGGNAVVVAQFYGAGDHQSVRKHASNGIMLLLLMGLVIMIAGLIFARPIFTNIVDVPTSFLDMAIVYFRIMLLGLVFQFGYNIFSGILRAVGDSNATLYFLLISSVLNVILDLLFVGSFKWGVEGAGWATVISQIVSFAAAYVYMYVRYPVFRFHLSDYHWDNDSMLMTIKMGLPMSIQMVVVSTGLTFVQRAVNGFGQTMTASFTVGQRVEMFLNIPGNALQATLATYTGQNIGGRRPERIRTGLQQSLIISFMLTGLTGLAMWIFADPFISLFKISEEAAVICRMHIHAVCFVNLFGALYFPLFGVFQGANHPAIPTVVAISSLGTRVLVTYLFRYSAFLGSSIIWWGGGFGLGMGFLVSWLYYLSGRWMKHSRISG